VGDRVANCDRVGEKTGTGCFLRWKTVSSLERNVKRTWDGGQANKGRGCIYTKRVVKIVFAWNAGVNQHLPGYEGRAKGEGVRPTGEGDSWLEVKVFLSWGGGKSPEGGRSPSLG